MGKLASAPSWAFVLVALAASALYLWRMSSVMVNRHQVVQYAFVFIPSALIAFFVSSHAKHGATNLGLLVYSDLVLAFLVGTLPVGTALRQFAVANPGLLPRDTPGKAPWIWIGTFALVLAALCAGEYVLFRR